MGSEEWWNRGGVDVLSGEVCSGLSRGDAVDLEMCRRLCAAVERREELDVFDGLVAVAVVTSEVDIDRLVVDRINRLLALIPDAAGRSFPSEVLGPLWALWALVFVERKAVAELETALGAWYAEVSAEWKMCCLSM